MGKNKTGEVDKSIFTKEEVNVILAGLEALKKEANKVAKLAKQMGLDGSFKEAEKRFMWIEDLRNKIL